MVLAAVISCLLLKTSLLQLVSLSELLTIATHFGGIAAIMKTARMVRNHHQCHMGTAVLCMTAGPEGIRHCVDWPVGFVW